MLFTVVAVAVALVVSLVVVDVAVVVIAHFGPTFRAAAVLYKPSPRQRDCPSRIHGDVATRPTCKLSIL